MPVLSDLDINKAVAELQGLLVADESDSGYNYGYREKYPSTIWVAKHEHGHQIEPWVQVNFVLTPDDAFPIILDNRISIEPFNDETSWYSSVVDADNNQHKCFDANALKAAMICYLKMNNRI
ncbi:phage protein NinX family protein [Vibrio parahaemolyticus]|uniref:phage protein NinX family protein n=1 Tax=Vibrio parahaemolyticus TaxID=670 RepID=UPI0025522E1A|nr:phage protein NinX family protein [Vibrio parahaemolyticus]